MRMPRALGAALVAVVAVFALTACIRLPFFDQGGGGTNGGGTSQAPADPDAGEGSDLVGTTWSGTDSDNDFWSFDFQEDGTVGFTLISDSYDDASDTWVVENGTLTISIVFDDGNAVMSGPYEAGATSIALGGTQGEAVWTVTVTQG